MNLNKADAIDFRQETFTLDQVKEYLDKENIEFEEIKDVYDFGQKWWRVIFKKKDEDKV